VPGVKREAASKSAAGEERPTLSDYFDIHLHHAPKDGAILSLNATTLVMRSISGGRINVVGLPPAEDEDDAPPPTKLEPSSADSVSSGHQLRGFWRCASSFLEEKWE
jgi:hypothetical protein